MFMVSPAKKPLHIAVCVVTKGKPQMPPKGHTEAKQELKERHRTWVLEVVKATKLKPSQIASQAGVSGTTLTRLLNDPDYLGALNQLTIDRIKNTFQLPGPEELAQKQPGEGGRMFGFAEAERIKDANIPPSLAGVIEALIGSRKLCVWRLRTSALELVGYLAGDLVFVDKLTEPKPQDAVCAQVYNWNSGNSETVFRIYDPPYIVGASMERTAYKPIVVDNERVRIKGVVVESYRPHRISALR